MSTADLSVIVPVHNGAATLASQLDALGAQEWDGGWEVVVVDNRSTDDTAVVIESFGRRDPRVRRVVADAKANLSYARNVGVAAAAADLVAFADADDVVGRGWVAAVAEGLRHAPLVASRLEWALLNEPAVRWGFQADGIGWDLGHPGVVGAGLGCARSLWEALGGNDEAWDDGGEDFEFSYRAHRDKGVVPTFLPDAVYHYRSRASVRGIFHQAARNGRAKVRLAEAFGDEPPGGGAALLDAAKGSLWLARHVGDLAAPDRRLSWVRVAGSRAGRTQASLRRHHSTDSR